MEEVAAAAEPVSALAAERLANAEALRRQYAAEGFDRAGAEARLDALLSGARTPEHVER